jgi:hypothetical protein
LIAPLNIYGMSEAQLDYWCSRADGIPPKELSIEPVPGPDHMICVRRAPGSAAATRYNPSTEPALAWPIIDNKRIMLGYGDAVAPGGAVTKYATARLFGVDEKHRGSTPLIAVIRAFVSSVYGATILGEVSQ